MGTDFLTSLGNTDQAVSDTLAARTTSPDALEAEMNLDTVLDAHAKPPDTLRALFKHFRKGVINTCSSIINPPCPNEKDIVWLTDGQRALPSEEDADKSSCTYWGDAFKPFEVKGLPGRRINH
jgi:hypothetical protein